MPKLECEEKGESGKKLVSDTSNEKEALIEGSTRNGGLNHNNNWILDKA